MNFNNFKWSGFKCKIIDRERPFTIYIYSFFLYFRLLLETTQKEGGVLLHRLHVRQRLRLFFLCLLCLLLLLVFFPSFIIA